MKKEQTQIILIQQVSKIAENEDEEQSLGLTGSHGYDVLLLRH